MRHYILIVSKMLQDIFDYLFRYLDHVVSLFGVILSFSGIIFLIFKGQSVLSWSYDYLIYIIALLFVFAFSFYWFYKKSRREIDIPVDNASARLTLLLVSLFFVLASLADFIFFHRTDIYQRPLLFFILISLLAGIIALEILYSSRTHQVLILFQIIFLGHMILWSQSLIYPTISGSDPWYHQQIVSSILDSSYVPNGLAYSLMPMFHLFASATALLCGTDYKIASILSVGDIQVICFALFIFVISISVLKNFKIGLMAALLVTIADRLIALSYKPIPNSYALVILLALLSIVFLSKSKFSVRHYMLFLILIFVMNLSHILVPVYLFLSMVFLFIFQYLLLKYERQVANSITSIFIPILCLSFMIFWWSFISGDINTLANLMDSGFTIKSQIVIPQDLLDHYDVPFYEQLFNSAGMLIYLIFSLTGVFYLLSIRSPKSISITVLGFLPLVVGAGSSLMGRSVLWYRWYYISEILLCIPLSITVFYLLNVSYPSKKHFKAACLFVTIFVFTIICIFNPSYNEDYPLFSQNSAVRYSLTDSEVFAATFISNATEEVYTDSDYRSIFSRYFSHLNPNLNSFKSLDDSFLSGQYDYTDSVLIFRTYITENPFRLHGAVYKINHDPIVVVGRTSSEIYSNGRVNMFY